MSDFVENKLPQPETLPQTENGNESSGEHTAPREQISVTEKVSEQMPVSPISFPVSAPQPIINPTVASIEEILSEDLFEHFKSMSPEVKTKFKKKGEETVSKLTELMGRTAIKAKEVLSLIIDWLKIIPGVNKYFLEQESKIKTDKIIELHKREHGE